MFTVYSFLKIITIICSYYKIYLFLKFMLNHFNVQYTDFDELERDFMQLCKNAQLYNEEASLIHEDSIVLQSVFTNARQRLQDGESDDEDTKGKIITSDLLFVFENCYFFLNFLQHFV